MRKYSNEKCDSCKFDHYDKDQVNIHMIKNHRFKLCLQCDNTIKNKEVLLKKTFCLKEVLRIKDPDITDHELSRLVKR